MIGGNLDQDDLDAIGVPNPHFDQAPGLRRGSPDDEGSASSWRPWQAREDPICMTAFAPAEWRKAAQIGAICMPIPPSMCAASVLRVSLSGYQMTVRLVIAGLADGPAAGGCLG